MTEYELASLNTQINDNMSSLLTNFITILSLYLGAGYLIAHRLTERTAIVFTGIFVLMYLGFCSGLYGAIRQQMGLFQEIRTFAAAGKGLAWHPWVGMPDWGAVIPLAIAVFNLSVVLIGAIYFFFSSRRQNLRREAAGAAPEIAAP